MITEIPEHYRIANKCIFVDWFLLAAVNVYGKEHDITYSELTRFNSLFSALPTEEKRRITGSRVVAATIFLSILQEYGHYKPIPKVGGTIINLDKGGNNG